MSEFHFIDASLRISATMKTFRFWVGFLLSFSILTGGTVVLFNSVVMPFVVGRDKVIVVPDVRGLTKGSAQQVIKRHGLIFKVAGTIDTTGVPPDIVLDQEPPAGMEVKKGREVKVTLSKRPIKLTTPVDSTIMLMQEIDSMSNIEGDSAKDTTGIYY